MAHTGAFPCLSMALYSEIYANTCLTPCCSYKVLNPDLKGNSYATRTVIVYSVPACTSNSQQLITLHAPQPYINKANIVGVYHRELWVVWFRMFCAADRCSIDHSYIAQVLSMAFLLNQPEVLYHHL